ncbi:MAG TPA: hypothetical protein P5329_11405 [Candidatus Competibacteraceae bacterium]|nr:hypothetical protein [Candidatus Competibacteraceae bacterium]HRX71757.1 hypothetical protein [Candidatus Competibacteraceae bacterium]
MKETNPKLLTGLLIDFLESQGAKRAMEDLAALCQEAYGQRSNSVPISKLLELARHHQLAADNCLKAVLAFLEVEYGGSVVLDGDTDTVIFKERGANGVAARVEVTGCILPD